MNEGRYFLKYNGNISISQFHNHAQYVQPVCLAGHTSCKYGGFYELGEILLRTYCN